MAGRIVAVFGNMVTASVDEVVTQNSVGYCCRGDERRLLSEVIRVRGSRADLQVFEETRGLKVGDRVEFTGQMLSVWLGPGLLGQVFDGLQNPLYQVAEREGYFLTPGVYVHALPTDVKWSFTPAAKIGQALAAGDKLGSVPEGMFDHDIMAPFALRGEWTLEKLSPAGEYTVEQEIAVLKSADGETRQVTMQQAWPVKVPLNVSQERLLPTEPLVTKIRILDTLFPVVRGGTYCIPGPFGAGKTVLQQLTSRHADVDIVIVAACGERAGEVVDTLREFPHLQDPRTGRSLMERTIMICNTSAMPVAAREASVYTAVTLAEYYRQMGRNVLLLADSTSRWAQAMREVSGRLEEIPGEEAFPAYLESRIAGFYERAGCVRLKDGTIGSVTIGGTVSPAGGNFEEPVTQGTLKVVGAFHGLSRARSDARRYPAIDPLDSWSKYTGIIDPEQVLEARALLRQGHEIYQMMAVVGEEGTSVEDFTVYLKSEFFDSVYLQQNAFDEVDGATPAERQKFVFAKCLEILRLDLGFESREEARRVMFRVADLFRNWNYAAWESEEFKSLLGQIDQAIQQRGRNLQAVSGEQPGKDAEPAEQEPGGEGEGQPQPQSKESAV